jgi:hypothetical protein
MRHMLTTDCVYDQTALVAVSDSDDVRIPTSGGGVHERLVGDDTLRRQLQRTAMIDAGLDQLVVEEAGDV